jgi:glycosyltransferase involved in cell wall biosynthesis
MRRYGLSTPSRTIGTIGSIVFTMFIKNLFFINLFFKILEHITYFLMLYRKKTPSINGDVLICRMEYLSRNIKTEEIISLDNTLGKESDTFAWDVEWRWFGSTGRRFEDYVITSKFKVVILSSWTESSKYYLTTKVLDKIRRHGIKVVTINWDTASRKFWKNYANWFDLFDLNVITDNPKKNYFNDDDCKRNLKTLFLFTPWISYPKITVKKRINYFFSGRVGSYRSTRLEYLKDLIVWNMGGVINIFDKDPIFDWPEMHSLLIDSKIVINFSQSVDGDQLKGRIFAAMSAECLVLESDNEQIKCYFEDGIDYVSFKNLSDLKEKIIYYTENENERKRIASNGHTKWKCKYSGLHFWEAIDGALNVGK